jgi:hypothetical protein
MEREFEAGLTLNVVPIDNRKIEVISDLDEDYAAERRLFKVHLFYGAVDTAQRIYIKPFCNDSDVGVAVFQADAQIGVIESDHRLTLLANWLQTWFDGELFIVHDASWGEELVLDIELFLTMKSPFRINSIELLPLAPGENALDFFFSAPLESLRNRKLTHTQATGETKLHLLDENLLILEYRGLLSDARSLPESTEEFFAGIGDSFYIQSEISIGLQDGKAKFSVHGSLRGPMKDEKLLRGLTTFKQASPNFAEEFGDLS